MKSLLVLFLLFISKIALSQINSKDIIERELPEIIVVSKEQSHKLCQLNLMKYYSPCAVSIRCNENLGVIIPQAIKRQIYIDNIIIPIRKSKIINNKNDSFKYSYHLFLQDKDRTHYKIIPKEIVYRTKTIKLVIDQYYSVIEPVSSFYFFLLPECFSSAYSSPDLFLFTFRYKSRLTYEWKNSQFEILNLKDRDATVFNSNRYLNWQVKVSYSYDNR